MKLALTVVCLVIAGCGGGSDESSCSTIARIASTDVALGTDGMQPVGSMAYRSEGGQVTIDGSFMLRGVSTARIRLYDSFASTQYDIPVASQNGMVQIRSFTWTPSNAQRTAVLYVEAAKGGVISQVTLQANECH